MVLITPEVGGGVTVAAVAGGGGNFRDYRDDVHVSERGFSLTTHTHKQSDFFRADLISI